MVTVSVNAYEDADLLAGCLESIREHIPHAAIQIVDGRYESFRPDGPDNSTDATPDLADEYGAQYIPAGPHADEQSKHWARIEHAPDGERCLFVDADERLLAFDEECLPADTVGRVRIHNALMYGEGDVTYYPRWFYPEQMEDIPRVDRFSFDAAVQRTDAITFTHRADLRDQSYRDAKLKRFEREDRDPWYANYLQELKEQGHAAEFYACPECGREAMTRSRVCGYGRSDDEFTRVETCTAEDRCHAAVVEEPFDGQYRYVPHELAKGMDQDPDRLRMELMHAGNDIARVVGPRQFERYLPNARVWCERNGITANTIPGHD